MCNTENDIIWNGKADIAYGGGIAFTLTGDHDNRPTDMTNIILYEKKDESER